MSDEQMNPAIAALQKMSPRAVLEPGSGPPRHMWRPDVAPGTDGCGSAQGCLWKEKKKQIDADTYQSYLLGKLNFG